MTTYALDANIIIRIIRRDEFIMEHWRKAVKSGTRLVISPVVDYEIQKGFEYRPSLKQQQTYDTVKDYCKIHDITTKTWQRAARIYAELRRRGFTVGDSDILIAAFCLENGYTLVTRNTKDFENIEGLKIVDWAG
ncbi:MAG: PIN domain-containing protein [Defluviitaleaceae bacterium]|nr:PIN domain-containing protein [Defluviitaleaceae bacterium]